MLTNTAKSKAKQLLCYIVILSLILSVTGTIYAEDDSVFKNKIEQSTEVMQAAELVETAADGFNTMTLNTITLNAGLQSNAPKIESVNEGDRSVTLGWRAAPGADRYEVYISTKSQSYTSPAAVTFSTSYKVTGLSNGTTYYFVVSAINEAGEIFSDEVSAVPRTVPSPPGNVRATAYNKSAVVYFDLPSDNGGRPITKYIVTSYPGFITAEGTSSPITVNGLQNGTRYAFTVKAVNEAGSSYESGRSNYVIPSSVPSPPGNVRATAYNKSAVVYFDLPSDNGGSPIIKYIVTSYPGNITAEGIRSPITVNGLQNGTSYTFTVKAVNETGISNESEQSNSVIPKTVPSPPGNVRATALSNRVVVRFNEPTDNGGSPIIKYIVTSYPGNITAEGTTSPITIKGLQEETSYTFTVKAVNEAGTSKESEHSNSVTLKSDLIDIIGSEITIDKKTNLPTVSNMKVTGTTENGILSAKVTEQMVRDAILAAWNKAIVSENEKDGIAVEFTVDGNDAGDGSNAGDGSGTVDGSGIWYGFNINLEDGIIGILEEAGVKYVKISSSLIDITFDSETVAEINNQATGAVTVSATVQKKLSFPARKLIGNRPVFDITVGYHNDGSMADIINFGSGTVTIGIPYTFAKGENTGNLYVLYIERNGSPHLLSNPAYENGRLIFQRNRLSTYGIGYKLPAPEFTDTENHWSREYIDFAAGNDLITGTSATTFAPDDFITRADFLMALVKLYGADVSGYKASSFTDVENENAAMPYIEWAAVKQIVKGIGNNMFGPELEISRQDMAVMMQNFARAVNYELAASIPSVVFSDNEKISSYARDAVKAIQQAGIMQGKENNIFDPKGYTTRAEASTILKRFKELVIDKGAIRGWSQNNDGDWIYIDENGNAQKGWFTEENIRYYFTSGGIMVSDKWLQIDGKWYYFNNDGSLAVSTKVDGYEVDKNGVRKYKK